MIRTYLYEPIAKVMLEIDVDQPTLIAMATTKVVAERSDFGQISRRSIIVGQLVLGSSLALDQIAKEKQARASEKALAGTETPPRKPRTPYSEIVRNYLGKRTALHRNLKDPTKTYIAIDAMASHQSGTYFNEQGEVFTREQVAPFLNSASAGGELPDYAYQMHSTATISNFALGNAPESLEAKKSVVQELIKALADAESAALVKESV